MALLIDSSCISCAACESECPNQAISAGDPVFLIDPERCTECVGAHEKPSCIEVCPIEGAIVEDPARRDSRDVLLAKYQRLHAAA
jgi:ferredoxin